MDYDIVVIGAGAAGEAVAWAGGEKGARVAVVEKDLVGGQCAFWACMPSKSLLDSANRRAIGADYPWPRASDRRDWMINREEIDYPDDSSHVAGLGDAELHRGTARIVGPGRVEVRSDGGKPQTLEARSLIVATGSEPVIPPIEGLEEAGYWTSPDATSLRRLPSSVVMLGGGPVGVEIAQVFARFGVPTVLVEGEDRLLPRDHPASSKAVQDQLSQEGVDVRTGVLAQGVRNGGKGRIVELSDGSSVEGAELVVSVGRRPPDMRELGLEEAGVNLDDRGRPPQHDERQQVGDGVYIAGDAAGGLQFTHVAYYQGTIAGRAALGDDVRGDLSAVPRTAFTDPETAAVGLTVDEARDKGIDAFEATQDFAATARGYTIEGSRGHLTAVVDRERGILVGAFAACPGASELIHEAVLAIKQAIPVSVLADVITAFPTASRTFGFALVDAAKQL